MLSLTMMEPLNVGFYRNFTQRSVVFPLLIDQIKWRINKFETFYNFITVTNKIVAVTIDSHAPAKKKRKEEMYFTFTNEFTIKKERKKGKSNNNLKNVNFTLSICMYLQNFS